MMKFVSEWNKKLMVSFNVNRCFGCIKSPIVELKTLAIQTDWKKKEPKAHSAILYSFPGISHYSNKSSCDLQRAITQKRGNNEQQ